MYSRRQPHPHPDPPPTVAAAMAAVRHEERTRKHTYPEITIDSTTYTLMSIILCVLVSLFY